MDTFLYSQCFHYAYDIILIWRTQGHDNELSDSNELCLVPNIKI